MDFFVILLKTIINIIFSRSYFIGFDINLNKFSFNNFFIFQDFTLKIETKIISL